MLQIKNVDVFTSMKQHKNILSVYKTSNKKFTKTNKKTSLI